jgi:hypothetical protein
MLAIPPSPPRAGPASARGPARPVSEGEDAQPVDSTAPAETEALSRPSAHEPTPEERALAEEAAAFNQTVRLQSEAEREMNALLALSMEQIKHDDEFLKKWIALI